MEHYKIKKHLDDIVDTIEKQKQLACFNSSIRFHNAVDYYFVSCGIEIIADVMGLKLDCLIDKINKFPYKYRFVYRNIEFWQYEEEPLEGVNHENV